MTRKITIGFVFDQTLHDILTDCDLHSCINCFAIMPCRSCLSFDAFRDASLPYSALPTLACSLIVLSIRKPQSYTFSMSNNTSHL